MKAPTQRLLQEVITSAIVACKRYQDTGRIPGCPANRMESEYRLNLASVREIDEDLLLLAGFEQVAKIKACAQGIVAKAEESPAFGAGMNEEELAGA